MKVLYLHGYRGVVSDEKRDILSKYFEVVEAPIIDWDDSKVRSNLFNSLIKLKDIDYVIGTSMGGQMAFFVALFLGKKGLVFNPAFEYLFDDFNFTWRVGTNAKIEVVLGKQDDVIDYKNTLKYLDERSKRLKNLKIELVDNMSHKIPSVIFEQKITEFLNKNVND